MPTINVPQPGVRPEPSPPLAIPAAYVSINGDGDVYLRCGTCEQIITDADGAALDYLAKSALGHQPECATETETTEV